MASKITPLSAVNVSASWQRLTTTSMNTVGQRVIVNTGGTMYFNTTNADAGLGLLVAGIYDFSGCDPATLWFKQTTGNPSVSGYVITE